MAYPLIIKPPLQKHNINNSEKHYKESSSFMETIKQPDKSVQEIVNLLVYGTPDPQKMPAEMFDYFFPKTANAAAKASNEIFRSLIKKTIRLLEKKYGRNRIKN